MSQSPNRMYRRHKFIPLDITGIIHVAFNPAIAFFLPGYIRTRFDHPPVRRSAICGGLPGFSRWFRQEFSDAYITRKDEEQFEHVYVDLQPEIHSAGRRAKNDEHAIKILYQRLNRMMHSTGRWGRSVVIAADGTAPATKLVTQRGRRRHKTDSNTDGISTLKIGAGTAFMTKVHDGLVLYGKTQSKKYPNDFVVDGPLVPGEGEVKLLGHLYENEKRAHDKSSTERPRVRRHVFVGGDSDLLIMAIAGYARLALSDTLGVGGLVAHDVLVLNLDAKDNKMFSAAKLANNIGKRFSHTGGPPSVSVSLRILLDFVLISIIACGNDYLQSLRDCDDISTLWQTYLDRRLLEARVGAEMDGNLVSLAEGSTQVNISWLAVANLTEAVNEKPTANFGPKTNAKYNAKQSGRLSQKILERGLRSNVNMYMNGVQWNLNMYAVGRCLDYRFGPKIPKISGEDLRLFAQILETDAPKPQNSRTEPIQPAIYNLLMQPLSGRSLVAPAIRPLMDEGSPISWLYSRGCRCVECYRLYSEALPLQRVIQTFSPRTDEAMIIKYDKVMAQLKPLELALKAHQVAAHDGDTAIFQELPSLRQVEKLARAAYKMERAANTTNQSSADERNERSWKFFKPQWFAGRPKRELGGGKTNEQRLSRRNR